MNGFLIDIDGTLANSDTIHFVAFQQICNKYINGFNLTEEFFEKNIHGKSNFEIFPSLFNKEMHKNEIIEIANEKEALFRELLMESFKKNSHINEMHAITGGRNFILWAKENNIKIGIVTNAPRLNAECVLNMLNIMNLIDCLIIGEECIESKPSPIPYLEGAKLLNLDIKNCIIFEDSSSGIKAAVAAKPLAIVGITSTCNVEQLLAYGVNYCISNYLKDDLKDFIKEKLIL